jgi:SAM-dependent methyltransferase
MPRRRTQIESGTLSATPRVFDLSHATALARAKADVLRELLPQLSRQVGLSTAVDIGCGLGYFSGLLRDAGLSVVAVDVRETNIAEARRRYPDIRFEVRDVEAPTLPTLGTFDVVLCFGLLYHLENPFRAIRNLEGLTGKVCIIESMVAPYAGPLAAFVEEGTGEDQGQTYLAQIPSETWLLKALSRAGFGYVYWYSPLPRHPDFRPRPYRRRRRTMVIASKLHLVVPGLRPATIPAATGRFMWYTFGLARLLEHPGVRNALKSVARTWRRTEPPRR